MAPASSTRSTTPRPPSGTPCSTSRCSAAAASTRTAGGRAPAPTELPWDMSPATLTTFGPGRVLGPGTRRRWELYYLPDDFSQAHDLAAEHPDKLKELQDLWWQEAERNRVLPLMGGFSILFGILPPLPTIDAVHVRGRRAEHPARHGAADLWALVRDRGRAERSRGRRRGRDRGQRRLHRRVRAVGRRDGPAPPHLLASSASRRTGRCRPSRSRLAT